MTPPDLRAPFPWFGGKSRCAHLAWAAIGDVTNYLEPFLGSAAVLLARPGGPGKIETVNDADGLLVNAWRGIAYAPEETAGWADWPVAEADLTARHVWLVGQRESMTERLSADPEWFDARAAGWWIWGQCAWIGSGWCSGEGPWRVDPETGLLADGNAGRGVHRQLPHLGNAGQGVHRKLPHLGDAAQTAAIGAWFTALSERLRRVRIANGDWARVVTPSVAERHGLTGMFLDAPYPEGWDVNAAYSGQTGAVSDLWRDVTTWAAEAGRSSQMRIVVAGYDGTWTPPKGWRSIPWQARKGYAADGGAASARERLWCSPGCLEIAEERGIQSSFAFPSPEPP